MQTIKFDSRSQSVLAAFLSEHTHSHWTIHRSETESTCGSIESHHSSGRQEVYLETEGRDFLSMYNLTVLRQRKPPPRRLTSTKSDPGFETGFPD